ncbi:MAG: hypothetical protein LBH43_05235 [Treponema sp.]|jgi:hypothetical protein|nr:hypothetical protein [Treponema sp.]
MAIQPIDLQTLFTQVDKVAKAQIAQKDGLILQQAIQGAQMQRKTEERIQSVNETQNTGEGVEKTGDRGEREQPAGGGRKRQERDEESREGGHTVIRDPSLGRNIDISL